MEKKSGVIFVFVLFRLFKNTAKDAPREEIVSCQGDYGFVARVTFQSVLSWFRFRRLLERENT